MSTRLPGVFIIVATVFALACAGTSVHHNPHRLKYADQFSITYHPHAFNQYPALVQQVVYEQGETLFEFTAVTEVTPKGLTIAGLSPLGNRLFLLTVTETAFTYEGQMLFELPFLPQYLMRDFLLTFASVAELQNQLPNLQIHETPKSRVLKKGRQSITITYSATGFAVGEILLHHEAAGYSVRISTVEVDFPVLANPPAPQKVN